MVTNRMRGWLQATMMVVVCAVPCMAAQVVGLRCESLDLPLGIDARQPELSWQMSDARRGARQSAYQIQVASDPDRLARGNADLWDSGRRAGGMAVHVVYGGAALRSRTRYYWRVRLWDQSGQASAYSAPAWWETGMLDRGDWQAEWIGLPLPKGVTHPPDPFFRKEFTLPAGVARARLYITALGTYIAHLNGARVGHDVLAPGWTDYRKHILYQTYDVTAQVHSGTNVLGAMVGEGWYGIGTGTDFPTYNFGDPPVRLLAELHVWLNNGQEQVIATDPSWQGTTGPILHSSLYDGEIYDARLEPTGWDQPGFAAPEWQPVRLFDRAPGRLVAQNAPPIRVTEELTPQKITQPAPGVYVMDLGQNMVGWAKLRVQGPAGTAVQLRFAEILQPDGMIYTLNLRRAKATDTFILKGGDEVFTPHFTYHGFRYVEVTGFPGTPTAAAVTGEVFHTDNPETLKFHTANAMVNQLAHNILWGLRGNLESVPTDCPQRDERLGWMGDAQIFWRTASFNMDMEAFTRKFTRDIRDAQSPAGGYSDVSPRVQGFDNRDGAPAWGDAGVIVPYRAYQQYGDRRVLADNWEAMEAWLAYIHGSNPDYLWTHGRNNDFGDWVPANSTTPKDLIATTFWAEDARYMATMARALGKSERAAHYDQLYDRIRQAFRAKFVQPDGTVGNGSQTCYVLSLHAGLLAEPAAAADRLVADIAGRSNHLSTGFLGTGYLMPVLSASGHDAMAYTLLLQTTYPSWGYTISRGATTMWERWNGDTGDPAMNSFNHYAYGVVGEWLYRFAAGIDTDPATPGFQHVVLHPHPDARLGELDASYASPYGRIASAWRLTKGGGLQWDVTVPANTTATAYVPVNGDGKVTESGQPAARAAGVKFLRREPKAAVYELGAGTYRFAGREGRRMRTARKRGPSAH